MAAPVAGDTVVASECLAAHEVEHAQLVGQRPRLGLVNPHQGGVDDKLLVPGQVERHVERLDEGVPTVRIAAEVRLRHPRHQVVDAPLPGIYGGDGEEEKVAPGDKRVRHAAFRLLRVHLHGGVGQRIVSQASDEGDVHHVEVHSGLPGNGTCHVHFLHMLLPVGKRQGTHAAEVLLRPEETRGGVLPSAEHHQGCIFVHIANKVLKLFQLEDVVGDIRVVDVAAVDTLHIAHDAYSHGQDEDFVERLGQCLHSHHLQQFIHRQQSAEGYREEDERIGALAEECGDDGPQGEVPPLGSNLHAAHHVGIDKRTGQESSQAGQRDAGCEAEDEIEVFLPLPERRGGQGHGRLGQKDEEEVHGKARPNDEPCLAESPHLGDAVIDDVRDGKDDEAGRDGECTDLHHFGFEQVGCDEADTEKYPHEHEGYRYGLVLHMFLFLTRCSSTRI